jgi:hypothetical protein
VLRPPFPLILHPNEGPSFVELTPELKQWINANDVDVLFHFGQSSWDMMTLGMQQDYIGQPTDWETITPDQAVNIFAAKDAAQLVRGAATGSSFGKGYRDGLDYVNALRTRGNIIGIYQLRGIDDPSGRGVEIRVKVVQGAQVGNDAAQSNGAAGMMPIGRLAVPGATP